MKNNSKKIKNQWHLGPDHYDEAVLPFYKALKVYPAPMELIMIYQKTIPDAVFQVIASIMAIEVRKNTALIIGVVLTNVDYSKRQWKVSKQNRPSMLLLRPLV